MRLKPYLLLDVDEVLNVDIDPHPLNFIEKTYRGFRFLLNPIHGEWLKSLSHEFELVWCTTLENDANLLICSAFNLPFFPAIEFSRPVGDGGLPGSTWKLPDVMNYVMDRPCAWVDDEFGYDAYDWAHLRNTVGIDTLIVRCRPNIGFTEQDYNALKTFGKSL